MTVRPRDALIKMEDVFTSRLQASANLSHRGSLMARDAHECSYLDATSN